MVVVLPSDRMRAVASGAPTCFQQVKNRAWRTCCVTDAVSERRNEEKKRKWARRKRMKGNGGRWGCERRRQTGGDGRGWGWGVPQVLTTGFYGSRYKEPCVGSRGRSLSAKTRCALDTRSKHCGKALIRPSPPHTPATPHHPPEPA